jgi:hypothetical protein
MPEFKTHGFIHIKRGIFLDICQLKIYERMGELAQDRIKRQGLV